MRPVSAPFRHTLLALAVTLGGLSTQALAESYQLLSAPLASTLNRIAADVGIALSIDPTLTAGKTAPAVKGELSPLQALSQALQGSNLRQVQNGADSFSLAPAACSTWSAAARRPSRPTRWSCKPAAMNTSRSTSTDRQDRRRGPVSLPRQRYSARQQLAHRPHPGQALLHRAEPDLEHQR